MYVCVYVCACVLFDCVREALRPEGLLQVVGEPPETPTMDTDEHRRLPLYVMCVWVSVCARLLI